MAIKPYAGFSRLGLILLMENIWHQISKYYMIAFVMLRDLPIAFSLCCQCHFFIQIIFLVTIKIRENPYSIPISFFRRMRLWTWMLHSLIYIFFSSIYSINWIQWFNNLRHLFTYKLLLNTISLIEQKLVHQTVLSVV